MSGLLAIYQKELAGYFRSPIAYFVVAVFLLGTGLVLLALAGLRALQTETDSTFDGDWTWAPYLIVVAGTIFVMVLALRAIGRHKRKARKHEARKQGAAR